MRVTVSHNKGLQGATKIVNDSADQLLAGAATGPVQITDMQRHWEGSTMDFSFRGRMGFLSSEIKGKVFVTEQDVTIDVELPGILKQFMPEEKVKAQLETRVRGLLNA
ncbi:MAG: polyhydroxyalkanoic acid system family protein [Bryobacteraceae bacterium]|nr:polyhydroxyalkanoic acid system family protein [Bryobacteraceae bacterium]